MACSAVMWDTWRGTPGAAPFICSTLGWYGIRDVQGVDTRMRRRSKRPPNTAESTGKIGQEIPSNQPAPLVPNYPDDAPLAAPPHQPRHSEPRSMEPRHAEPRHTGPRP